MRTPVRKDISLFFDNSNERKKKIEENPTSSCVYIFSNVIVEKILLDNQISFEDCVIGAIEEDRTKAIKIVSLVK